MSGHVDDDVARVMARNAEILECKRQIQFWSNRLAELETCRRREALLASFDLDPRGTWLKLTEDEQQDRDWVIKGISNGVFGRNPWRTCRGIDDVAFGCEDLPEQFREDRDVVLAFVACDSFRRVFYDDMFTVPWSLTDDKEVMLAVCAKNSKALRLASRRLQDDLDVVSAALGGAEHYDRSQLEHASMRLRSDRDFILRLIHSTSHCYFGWIQYAQLGLEDEKEVALAALNRVSELNNSGRSCDSGSSGIVGNLSEALRDDRDVMLRYVEDHWANLDDCSNRLKSSEEFVSTAVSQNVNALMFCPEAAKEDTFSKRDKTDVIQELEDGDLWFESLPKEMRTDPRVLMAALKGDSLSFEDLPDDLQRDRNFVLAIHEGPNSYYDTLSEELQNDEQLCLELLKKKYGWPKTILDKVPSLYRSREAIIAATKVSPQRCRYGTETPYIIQHCSFRDDEEVMLLACENDIRCLQCASERLKSDRGFVLSVISCPWGCAAIQYISRDFQVNNTDIVFEAIELSDAKDSYLARRPGILAPELWQNRLTVLACLKKGWPILQKLERDCPLLDDDELVRLAVENSGVSELEYASSSLKRSREFALSVVKINGLSLSYVDTVFKRDDEIVTEAIANTGNTILNCFRSEDDFGYLVSFAARVRSRLELHKSFLNDFLRGISVSRPHVAPAKRCRLPILDRGSETSTAFKKLIAEYLGVPMKKELHLLRTASENLRKLRY